MNRELRTECPLCASALYVGDTCPQHCSVLDVAEVFEQRIAHIQKALNERELELLRVKGENERLRGERAEAIEASRGWSVEWGKAMHDWNETISSLDAARARLAVLEPVFRFAVQWRHFEGTTTPGSLVDPTASLIAAIDTALAATEGKDKP